MGAALFVATWAFVVAPSGMPHSGPDMSPRDMRLMAVSGEAAGLAGTEPLTGLVQPTWLLQAGDPSYHRSICQPSLGRTELPGALSS